MSIRRRSANGSQVHALVDARPRRGRRRSRGRSGCRAGRATRPTEVRKPEVTTIGVLGHAAAVDEVEQQVARVAHLGAHDAGGAGRHHLGADADRGVGDQRDLGGAAGDARDLAGQAAVGRAESSRPPRSPAGRPAAPSLGALVDLDARVPDVGRAGDHARRHRLGALREALLLVRARRGPSAARRRAAAVRALGELLERSASTSLPRAPRSRPWRRRCRRPSRTGRGPA